MSYDPSLQIFQSPSNWFSLYYPRLWEEETIEGIPTFFNPFMGEGALQVFAIRLGNLQEENEITEEYPFLKAATLNDKMELFLQQQQADYEPENFSYTRNEDMDIVAVEYRIDERFYTACMYEKNPLYALALYNCKGLPSAEEAENIGKILRSLHLTRL